MSRSALPRGLYAVTSPAWGEGADLLRHAAAVIRGGAVMLQYRDKAANSKRDRLRRLRDSAGLNVLCRAAGVPLFINDDIALARAVGAHGVHLGQLDAELQHLRQRLGEDLLIGISCYDNLARARRAAVAGADYLSFGALFPSPTKPGAPRAPSLLLPAARHLGLPIAAIGGVHAGNVGRAAAAGADLVAVISALENRASAQQTAAAIQSRWKESYPS